MYLPESLLGEEDVQSLPVVGVDLAMQEDPVLGQQDLLGGCNETRFSMVGGVEDLSGHFVGRTDDDETVLRISIHRSAFFDT